MLPETRLDEILQRFAYLEARLAAPGASPGDLADSGREHARLQPVVAAITEWRDARNAREEAQILAAESAAEPAMRALADEEIARLDARIPELEDRIRLALLPRDIADDRPAIVEIRPGTGGEEAALFAADLMRLYQRHAEAQGWDWQLIALSQSELGGVREAVVRLGGEGVFARMKYESGVHRVQRVPVTESGGRIHTSAATVAVLPEAAPVDLAIDEADLKIDTMRASGAGGQHVNTTDSAVRITHLPSGISVVSSEKSQHQNRRLAMEVLRARLFALERARVDAARAADRRAQLGTGDRSERIRTYNFPQGRVSDHRINLTLYALDQVMAGDLAPLTDALVAHDQAAQLAEMGA
ncbi:MAG: peptide chain release factor 1 [Pararhodobacter sp.]|nr:peptide chain release factor 1 [Pararhodobacter sp.]